jgi:hypothetical protein
MLPRLFMDYGTVIVREFRLVTKFRLTLRIGRRVIKNHDHKNDLFNLRKSKSNDYGGFLVNNKSTKIGTSSTLKL